MCIGRVSPVARAASASAPTLPVLADWSVDPSDQA